jgi:hypothetical protein
MAVFIPYERITYITNLNKDEVIKRLASKIDPNPSLLNWKFGKLDRPFKGKLLGDNFSLLKINYNGTSLPTISGKIEDSKGKVTISVIIKFDRLLIVFILLLYLTFFAVTLAFIISSNRSYWPTILFPVAPILFSYIVGMISFNFKSSFIKDDLKEIFQREYITPQQQYSMKMNQLKVKLTQRKFWLKYCLFTTLLFAVIQVFSQKNEKFNARLATFDISYNKPEGYIESDSILELINGAIPNRFGSSYYSLTSKKDSIVICFQFNGPIDTSSILSGFPGNDGRPFDPNKNYIPYKTRYEIFPAVYTTRVYNADVSGMYDFVPFKNESAIGGYNKCKVIFIHKNNRVDLHLFYYYNKGSEEKVKRHIKETKGMLRFNN